MNQKTILQRLLFRKESKTVTHVNFIPVLGFEHLSEYYDAIMFLSGLGKNFKKRISALVSPSKHSLHIADIGCGTGTQLSALCEVYPFAHITGIDLDASLLKKARERIAPHANRVHLSVASATDTKLERNSLDLCFSTLVFHHLTHQQKIDAFTEVYRILKPGGTFLLTDWGELWFTPFRYLLIFEDQERLEDHIHGRIPSFAHDAGFTLLKTTKVKPTGIWAWEFKKPETIL